MYEVKKNKQGKWIIIKKGAKRASKSFNTKMEAVEYAEMHYKDRYEVKQTDEPIVHKKKKKIFIILFILILILFVTIVILYSKGYLDEFLPSNDDISDKDNNDTNDNGDDNETDNPNTGNTNTEATAGITENIIYEDFQIHFLELGNKYSGDCTYIKAGDNDILIDAGSRQSSVKTIKEYINQYCTDGKLEYVIATHADQDHIAGMVGTTSDAGILSAYEIDTIIDFNYSTKDLTTSSGNDTLYGKYIKARDEAVTNGATHYTAKECFNEENGAKSTYVLGEDISLTIIYNYFYFNKSNDENNHSVCTLFSYKEHDFLLTGDLEQEGEEKLAEYYTTHDGLGEVDLFKGGHHGSATSSNECLLSIIKPEICCVCCCAGSTEYTANYNNIFPTQDFITRIAKYTDRVYVTTVFNENSLAFESLNGNIIVSCNGVGIGLKASNNLTKLKDTDWFNATVYVNSSNNICSGKAKEDFFTIETSGVTAVKRRIWPTT